MCVCHAIQRFPNRIGITVVQHPGERHHPFNTARLARLGLKQVDVQMAWDGRIERPPLSTHAALLYPAEGARDLATIPAEQLPDHLVVLDGTWPQARSLYRDNPWISGLPHVALSPDKPGAYRIRKEPAAHCLSTIESIASALAICEPDSPGIDHLLDGFTALIEGQLAHRSQAKPSPRRPVRSGPSRTQQLHQRWSDVVVLYVETTPARGTVPAASLQLVQVTAFRPATQQAFDCIVQVNGPTNECKIRHMELGEEDLSTAVPFATVQSQWKRFRTESDLYVAWSWAGAEEALEKLGEPTSVVRLKSVYCNVRRGPSGRPDQVLLREGLQPMTVATRGRAANRLGNAAALAHWLAEQGA